MSNVEDRYKIITQDTVELLTSEDLRARLAEKAELKGYIGFEPSGLMHIAQGIICAKKIRDLNDAGVKMVVYMADWHAYINDKLGADIERLQTCGKYMEEVFLALGVDPSKTEFVYASKLLDTIDFWEKVLRIAKASSLHRVRRAMTIMGRKGGADSDSSKFFYPAMQVADIFQLEVDIAYGGMDQRKAHVLAREVAEKLGYPKPIALHTPLLMGLQGSGRMDYSEAEVAVDEEDARLIDMKMSKSSPDSAVYFHDSPDDIKRKLKKAYCPEGDIRENPIMEMCKYIVFPNFNSVKVERPEKFGGDMEFDRYDILEESFEGMQLHPLDLKMAVAHYIDELVKPVRDYFDKNPKNLEAVKKFEITK
ncbi:MAG: tyrosine--tRNA ligase [Thermoplasmata archaeon]|nr:MAG: tyrosine--tRNA ligase [Thermoplasmata archaeon]